MKKLISVCLIIIAFLPVFVSAKDIYLEELNILNGELSPSFDSLNNEYTVTLSKEEYNIEMDYKVADGITVSIENNFDLENNSVVTIQLEEEKSTTSYRLHILKEEEENTLSTFNEETIEVPNNIMYTYKIYIIPSVCFLLILITYKCIFYKKKKHKK